MTICLSDISQNPPQEEKGALGRRVSLRTRRFDSGYMGDNAHTSKYSVSIIMCIMRKIMGKPFNFGSRHVLVHLLDFVYVE